MILAQYLLSETCHLIIIKGLVQKKLTEFSVKVGGWGQHRTNFPLIFLVAQQLYTHSCVFSLLFSFSLSSVFLPLIGQACSFHLFCLWFSCLSLVNYNNEKYSTWDFH